jgi:hypothetical protein
MQQASSSSLTMINPNFGQIKNKGVSAVHYSFLDSFWYNAPFSNGQQIDTYPVKPAADEIVSLGDPNLLTEYGYVNIVLSQD